MYIKCLHLTKIVFILKLGGEKSAHSSKAFHLNLCSLCFVDIASMYFIVVQIHLVKIGGDQIMKFDYFSLSMTLIEGHFILSYQ